MASTSVKFAAGELEVARAAAAAAGLSLNGWVRRACRQAAELERALDREAGEQPGEDIREPTAPLGSETVAALEARGVVLPDWQPRSFKPDFK